MHDKNYFEQWKAEREAANKKRDEIDYNHPNNDVYREFLEIMQKGLFVVAVAIAVNIPIYLGIAHFQKPRIFDINQDGVEDRIIQRRVARLSVSYDLEDQVQFGVIVNGNLEYMNKEQFAYHRSITRAVE